MDRRGISRAAIAVAGAVTVLSVVASAAEIVRVSTLPRDGQLLVSFEMADGYTVEIREAVLSGLPTTFSYVVELRRTTAFWFDRTVASAAVSVSVQYDNLTRLYQVSRMQDGRVEETRVVEKEDDVRQALTRFARLPLFSTTPLEANGEYSVRVRAETRPHNGRFFWPWDRTVASVDARFTFLP